MVLNYQLHAYVLFYFINGEVWLLQNLTRLFINTFLYRVLYKPWSGFFRKFQDLKDLFPTVGEQKLMFHTWKWAEYWKCLSLNNKPKLQCKSCKIAFKLGKETIPGVKNHGSVKSSFKDIGSLMEHSSNYVHALLQ